MHSPGRPTSWAPMPLFPILRFRPASIRCRRPSPHWRVSPRPWRSGHRFQERPRGARLRLSRLPSRRSPIGSRNTQNRTVENRRKQGSRLLRVESRPDEAIPGRFDELRVLHLGHMPAVREDHHVGVREMLRCSMGSSRVDQRILTPVDEQGGGLHSLG